MPPPPITVIFTGCAACARDAPSASIAAAACSHPILLMSTPVRRGAHHSIGAFARDTDRRQQYDWPHSDRTLRPWSNLIMSVPRDSFGVRTVLASAVALMF